MPLYKAQQESSIEAVIKSNAFSVQRLIDNLLALGTNVNIGHLHLQLKVKGKPLPMTCYDITATGGKDSADPPGVTVVSGGLVASKSIETTEAWAIRIKGKGTTDTTCPLEAKFNVCFDSVGVITKDTEGTTITCPTTDNLNR